MIINVKANFWGLGMGITIMPREILFLQHKKSTKLFKGFLVNENSLFHKKFDQIPARWISFFLMQLEWLYTSLGWRGHPVSRSSALPPLKGGREGQHWFPDTLQISHMYSADVQVSYSN